MVRFHSFPPESFKAMHVKYNIVSNSLRSIPNALLGEAFKIIAAYDRKLNDTTRFEIYVSPNPGIFYLFAHDLDNKPSMETLREWCWEENKK